MSQNAFGAPHGPAVGAYSAPPNPRAGLKGMGGGIRGERGRGTEGVKGKR